MIRECFVNESPRVDVWPLRLSVGDGGFFGSVKHYYGYNHIHRSVLSSEEQENMFRYFMMKKEIKTIVETGTYNGTTTALLAHYADKVITIDKKNYIDKFPFWIDYQVYNKIKSYIIDDDADKAELLKNIDFDFAFIDGDHSEKGVRADFELVKRCGRVLFHDYYEVGSKLDFGAARSQGVCKVVDELPDDEVAIGRPFAYWEKSGYGNNTD